MEDFIKWLETNPDLIIQKLKNNIKTSEELEAEIVIEDKILCPSTALEYAEVFEETLNLVAIFDLYKVKLPTNVKEDLIGLAKTDIAKTIELAKKEANNDGNLLLFINAVIEKEPVPMEYINFTDNMIGLSFKGFEEGVV
ncbi:MAG: hypothetical protein IKG36_00920, partial [Mycoplasmataceae bacterium]|nr:hypothetical protein [Mycoplasmataceae bacterium]